MTRSSATVGSLEWTLASAGELTRGERRRLLVPLARVHLGNVIGRTSMWAHANSGRRAVVPAGAMRAPDTALTNAAEASARARLSPALLNHSYRAFAFGAAVGVLEGLEVDRELLFAAAMLHDVGLAHLSPGTDFTLASARVARVVAEEVGLSTSATETMRDAITMHHNPRVTRREGSVAYLLAAGAGVDVAGLRSWELPPELLMQVVDEWPRLGFKREFTAAWRAEAAAVPQGRARFLRKYGALDVAVRLAPFQE